MASAALAIWPLLLGVALLFLGHGLQGTLLAVRASIEGFQPLVTGLIMSGYSLGYIASALLTHRLIRRVGLVRVFAALASLASTAVLVHAVFVEPTAWFVLRFVSGFCISGTFIVAESWLNGSATNDTRGSLLSIYMIVQLLGWAGGQFLLNIADPGGFNLFITVSVLISLALIPMLLTANPAPIVAGGRSFGLLELFRVSPLGFIGMLVVGMCQGAFFSMGAVYGNLIGLSLAGISTFIAVTIVGGIFLQWPVGWLSDRLDRRQVLMGTTFLAASALIVTVAGDMTTLLALSTVYFVYGGVCLPMYSLAIAHTNDFLDNEQRVDASSALILTVGIGLVVGPTLASLLMQLFGAIGLPAFLIVMHCALGIFAIYRMTQRDTVAIDEQSAYYYLNQTSPVITAVAQEAASEQVDARAG